MFMQPKPIKPGKKEIATLIYYHTTEPFFPRFILLYLQIESPNPKKTESPTPQAPNPINRKPHPQKPKIRPQTQNPQPQTTKKEQKKEKIKKKKPRKKNIH